MNTSIFKQCNPWLERWTIGVYQNTIYETPSKVYNKIKIGVQVPSFARIGIIALRRRFLLIFVRLRGSLPSVPLPLVKFLFPYVILVHHIRTRHLYQNIARRIRADGDGSDSGHTSALEVQRTDGVPGEMRARQRVYRGFFQKTKENHGRICQDTIKSYVLTHKWQSSELRTDPAKYIVPVFALQKVLSLDQTR